MPKILDREPTQEMLKAGDLESYSEEATYETVFLAMYDAAPEIKQEPVATYIGLSGVTGQVYRQEKEVPCGTVLYAYPPDAQAEIDKRDERIKELEEDKATLVRNCNQSIDAMQGQQETIAEQAKRIKELEFSWAGCSQQLKDACDDLNRAQEHSRMQALSIADHVDVRGEQAAEITRLKALVGKCKDGIEGALSDDLPYINKCKEALAAIKEERL